ncbi:hypothetical protein HYW20_04100 [Candidatus Woesearchaeota archaeon]|nr:hypothetical protein [Candidatus Woesearchaeota archaeon]
MGHLKIVVDHEKIDYNGPVNVSDLLRMIENFLFERGFDKRQDKDFEQHTSHGKFIEWQIAPWKKVTDYIRYIVKVRVLGYDILKTDVVSNGKKSRIDTARIIIVIDGFMEYDYDNYWDDKPILFFLRTIYDYFIFKAYTERFEHRLVHDINHLHHNIEKFLNLYGHYTVISKPA